MARSESGSEQQPMTDEQFDELSAVIDEMRANTREYLEAHGIGPDEHEYDPDLAFDDEGDS